MGERVGYVEATFAGLDRRPALHRAADADGAAAFADFLPDGLAAKAVRRLSQVFDAMALVVHPAMKRGPGHPGGQLADVDRFGGELMRAPEKPPHVREFWIAAVAVEQPPRNLVDLQQQ